MTPLPLPIHIICPFFLFPGDMVCVCVWEGGALLPNTIAFNSKGPFNIAPFFFYLILSNYIHKHVREHVKI